MKEDPPALVIRLEQIARELAERTAEMQYNLQKISDDLAASQAAVRLKLSEEMRRL